MKFKRMVWKQATSKVVTVPKDLEIGKEYLFTVEEVSDEKENSP